MNDMRNYALLALVALLTLATIIGHGIIIQRWDVLQRITGLQSSTDTGTATVTVESEGAITFAVDTISFGSGRVNTSNGNDRCILDTNGTNESFRCINFTATAPTGPQPGGFQLENAGSANATVQLLFSNNADGFLGGSSSINEYRYAVRQNDTENASCTNSTGQYGTSGNCNQNSNTTCTVGPIGWFDVNTTSPGSTICQKLLFTDTNDSIVVEINITVPYDSGAGAKSSTLTATGTTTT